MKKTTLTMITALSLLLGLSASSLAEKTVPKEGVKKTAARAARATAVFDLAHSEIFSPLQDGPLNYSSFYNAVKTSGEEVGVNKEPITKARLKGVKTYIIAGPVQSLSADEVSTLESFVKDGGNLLVLLHISSPVSQLTNSFGILVSNFTIGERTGLIENRSQDFIVSKFAPHSVTSGVKKIAVYGTWGLMSNDPAATVVASTTPKAWADIDRNREYDQGEPVQEFGIVAVREFGKGKVAVVADDAPFANRFIGQADNKLLAENLIKWFRK